MSALKQQLQALQLAGSGSGTTGGKENGGAGGSAHGAGAGAAAGPRAPDAAAATSAYHAQLAGGVVLQGQLGEAVQRLLRERELLLSRCGAAEVVQEQVQRSWGPGWLESMWLALVKAPSPPVGRWHPSLTGCSCPPVPLLLAAGHMPQTTRWCSGWTGASRSALRWRHPADVGSAK